MSSVASRLFAQPFVPAQIKDNIKYPRHWPLLGESTGDSTDDRWNPLTKGHQRGKCFHLITLPWIGPIWRQPIGKNKFHISPSCVNQLRSANTYSLIRGNNQYSLKIFPRFIRFHPKQPKRIEVLTGAVATILLLRKLIWYNSRIIQWKFLT